VITTARQFPRLLNPDTIKDTIARGVENGMLGYVGKKADGSYAPFHWNSSLPPQDVEISDDVFLIQRELAEAYNAGNTSSTTGTSGTIAASGATATSGATDAFATTGTSGATGILPDGFLAAVAQAAADLREGRRSLRLATPRGHWQATSARLHQQTAHPRIPVHRVAPIAKLFPLLPDSSYQSLQVVPHCQS